MGLRTLGFRDGFDERGAVGASVSSRACGRTPLITEMTDVREMGWSTVGDDSIAICVAIIVRVL
ncbi:hypothetical protein N7517_005022 [Penicillium concentricum]|uniref:Uncharacterized protein n=1 Tax=Penicillium concentricum TaxID=293559 RepID=A0A9W9VB79_9EURO|nr:uncharacterized protein N7517_005022 [Penicillium concentricum]KAJ5373016.1 hypothetical protein N7517_005022 [Penicillium concentricum]